MSRHPNSFLFLIGMTSMCAVWLSTPFWPTNQKTQKTAVNEKTATPPRKTTFQYAVPERNRPLEVEVTLEKLESIRRQLQRRANMENSGFTKKIIQNEEMPEEVRKRFAAEKERLDHLALAYPELAAEADKIPVQRQVDDLGELTPEFKDAARMMDLSGAWDELNQNFLDQLQRAAKDETLPSEERPSQEFIDSVRSERLIPSL